LTAAPLKGLWPHGDPRDVARSIVAGPSYRVPAAAPAPQPSWFELFLDWLGGLVRGLLHGLDRVLGAHNRFEAGIGFVLIAAAFALLGCAIYLLVRSYLSGPRRRPRAGPETMPAAVARSSAELRAAARRAAQLQRYRDAAALLFLAAVRALDERGRVAYDPARTPGEYRRLVHDPLFDAFAGDAVVAVFAAAEPAGEIFERMSGAYDRLFAASGRPGAP
jgi:hypothetical protein